MSVQIRLAVSAAAFVGTAFFVPILVPGGANAAETCLTAPNKPAPQGSHWYYRLERPSQRKCWRLVQKDRKGQATAARAAEPEPAPQDEPAAPPAPATPAPAASKPAERPAQTEAKPVPAPVIQTLVTRNVSNTNETAPSRPPEPSAPAPGAAVPAPAPQAAIGAPAPAMPAEPPQPVAAPNPAADVSGSGGALWLLLQALALMGLLAGAAFGIMLIVRRRTDVLDTMPEPDDMTFDENAAAAASEPPTFAPLPPMALAPREDDVDAALRRFARNVRRRAA